MGDNSRLKMTDDLMKNYLLIGITMDTAILLLGQTHKRESDLVLKRT
jgi:hypothetical protein